MVFKIDVIDSKKWVKLVVMQKESATLIYDLHKMKGAVESYLKKHSHSKQYSSKPENRI